MTSEMTRTPEMIAGEINSIKSQTSAILGAAFAVARASCFEIGRRLEEAKSLLPHGEWGKWLDENVAYSESTANNLMRIYREFGDEQIDMLTGKCPRDVFGDLSQSQLVELFALPPAERVAYVEEHREEMEGQSVRELHRQIAEYKEKLEIAELQRDDAKRVEGLEFDKRRAAEEKLNAARAEIESLKDRPVEAQVIVHQPSEEQLEQLRAEIAAEEAEKYDAKLEETAGDVARQREADKKKWETAEAELKKKLEKAEADLKKSREKADEASSEHEHKVDAIRADYEKRLRAASLQGNVRSARISLYLSDVARLLGQICDELDGMEREESGAGERMKARLASQLDRVLSERGLTV